MYRVDSKRLRELVTDHGASTLAEASIAARCSVSLLQKMYAGTYRSSPRKSVREDIAKFFSVPEDELFPLVSAKGGSRRRAK